VADNSAPVLPPGIHPTSARKTAAVWWPTAVASTVISVLWLRGDTTSYESETLLRVADAVFSAGVAVVIAMLAGRSYLDGGEPALLALTVAMLVSGLSSTAGMLGSIGNDNITLHNLGMLASAAFHVAGGWISRSQNISKMAVTPRTGREGRLTIGVAAGLSLVGLFWFATERNRLPVFFVDGQGGAPIRTWILSAAITLFVMTSALHQATCLRTGSRLLRWYAPGLALLAIGLVGVLLQSTHGSLLSWASRFTQYAGNVYLLIGTLAAVRHSPGWRLHFDDHRQRLAEAQNRASRLAEMLENSSQPFASGYPDGRLGLFNQAFASLTGYTSEELRSRTWAADLTPEKWRPVETAILRRLHETGEPQTYQKEYRRKDGALIPVEIKVHLVRDAAEPEHYYAFVTDISDRIRATEAIQQSERRIREALDSLTDGMISFDSDCRMTFFNAEAERICELPREEAIGKKWQDVFAGVSGTRLEEQILTCMRERKPVEFENYYEPWDRWYAVKAYPTPDGGCAHFFRDITDQKRAEETIAQNQKILFELVERCPFGIYIVDSSFRITSMNSRSQERAFRNVRPVIGRPFEETMNILWPPAVAAEIVARFRRTLETGEPYYSSDFIRPRADIDETEGYEWELHRIRLPDGEFGVVCYYYDSTQLRRTETELARTAEVLAQERERLAIALRTGQMGVYEWTPSRNEVWWSPETFAVFGQDPATFQPTVEAFQELVHPDDRADLWKKTQEAVERRELFIHEYRIRRPDGATRWVFNQSRVAVSESGEIERITGVAVDITDRKFAQQALVESERRYRVLADAMPQIVYITRADGQKEYLNEQWRTYTGRTVAGPDVMKELVHADDLPALFQLWERARTAGHIFTCEFRLRNQCGEYRWFLTRAVPLHDSQGQIVRWFGTSTDIHDRKLVALENARLVEELKESDRRKDEFLSILAHELRNPLAPLRTGLELLTLSQDDPEVSSQARAIMQRQLEHMVRLIDDLLDLTRISRGKITLQRQVLSMADVLQSALETSQPLIDERNQQLKLDLTPEELLVNGDSTRLSQILSNLLNNAAKYTEQGGRIRLSLRRHGDQAEVTVEDNGVGIPLSMQAHVFDMFTQVDRTIEKSQGGLGIGLWIVKQLTELHGGDIHVQSAGPGQGSCFTLRLPLAGDTDQPRISNGTAPGTRTTDAWTILVVDDNRDAANSLSQLLQKRGHQVSVAYDGEEAIRVAETCRPDAILMDLGMPRISGYDACRQIRSRLSGRPVVIIACTGWGQPADRQRSTSAGFDLHLVKPLNVDLLEQSIRTIHAPSPLAISDGSANRDGVP
jgi:PAS domain S-box-containing protein